MFSYKQMNAQTDIGRHIIATSPPVEGNKECKVAEIWKYFPFKGVFFFFSLLALTGKRSKEDVVFWLHVVLMKEYLACITPSEDNN